ncbi:8158_t:CDS:2 [Diversispora eburnea]|uniref:8158_t:CDS:1 n=1 Tax=Diversispora eburnea TaxID=1213867 RepID=A0A9N8YX35_9GLOM|nr:8158_t:CDS:2 [Diversispora eburnea]
MTYWEVREKLYKLYFDQDEEEDEASEGQFGELPNTIETVPWNKDLENRLCQLYVRDDVVDIFWCRNIPTDKKTLSVYVVTRNLSRLEYTEEATKGQVIHFIPEEKGFLNTEIPPQRAYDPLPTQNKFPQDLQKAFDEALNNELGSSFREVNYKLVGMSTGCKRTKEIREYPVDVVEACVATPYGFGASYCQAYKGDVKLGRSSHDDLDERKRLLVEIALDDEMYKEESEMRQKDFGVDSAFCIFTNKNQKLCPNKFSVSPECFEKEKLPENICLNGFYTYENFDNIDEIEVFKVERETGLSCVKFVPISSANCIDLRDLDFTNKCIEFAAETHGEIPTYNIITDKEHFVRYMKTPTFQNCQKCYPTVWLDWQLIFSFRTRDFEPGDSGASVVDRKGKALENSKYAIASPYFAVFEALDVEPVET